MNVNVVEAAKEIIRVGTTAGLSKDVIDLLEKKLWLLTDEMSLLVKKNAELVAKASALETENSNLRAQIQNLQPVTGTFNEYGGVLWKRTASGFEKFPYCKECAHHPVMMGMPPNRRAMFWQCPSGHTAPFQDFPAK
jgi:hypothetical protein